MLLWHRAGSLTPQHNTDRTEKKKYQTKYSTEYFTDTDVRELNECEHYIVDVYQVTRDANV